jgi:hypothetical protein
LLFNHRHNEADDEDVKGIEEAAVVVGEEESNG